MVDAVVINDKFALDLRMGPVFQTTIVPLLGGYEDRNQDWSVAMWRYDAELKNRPLAEIAEFIEFLLGRRGAARSFLLRDPLYDTLTDENIGTGNGSTTAFQVRQTFADPVNPYYRWWYSITSLVVKVAGVTKTAGVHYNEANGLVTFTAGNIPTSGQAITASGSPYVRVRFAEDENPITLPVPPGLTTPFASAGPFRLMEVPS
jgi:uncharacterized protein (TIGR02217 family)